MLYLADIKDWLKTVFDADYFYMGKLDNKNDKSLGVYQRKENNSPRVCVGGTDMASYEIKRVSILIHWTNDADITEKAAQALYDTIVKCDNVVINQIHVPYIEMQSAEPIDVGTDDKGIYERVIELDLYYKKRGN